MLRAAESNSLRLKPQLEVSELLTGINLANEIKPLRQMCCVSLYQKQGWGIGVILKQQLIN